MLRFGGLHFVKELCVNVWYALTMDLSVSIIEDDYKLDFTILKRILERKHKLRRVRAYRLVSGASCVMTRLTSIRALEWLPLWILEVVTSGLAPCEL